MKGQRKFQLLIADIRYALADVARENRYGDLFHATWALMRFEDELARDIGKLRELRPRLVIVQLAPIITSSDHRAHRIACLRLLKWRRGGLKA